MTTYAGIEEQYGGFNSASILLQPIPYDGTSTWGKGADKGPDAFLEASKNMELYDIETDSEVYKKGIHLLDSIVENSSPKALVNVVYTKTKELLRTEKFLTFLGGEHSISIGVVRAFSEMYPDITILHFDAHADLRPHYEGTPFSHACALHEASKSTNLIQIGIRSMDESEKPFLNQDQCYFAHDIHGKTDWIEKSLSQINNPVYITLDLDVFDPSIMPATGTPEPGGLDWYTIVNYLKRIFQEKHVVGFDINELAPIQGLTAPNFLAAKLYYKMLSYRFAYEK